MAGLSRSVSLLVLCLLAILSVTVGVAAEQARDVAKTLPPGVLARTVVNYATSRTGADLMICWMHSRRERNRPLARSAIRLACRVLPSSFSAIALRRDRLGRDSAAKCAAEGRRRRRGPVHQDEECCLPSGCHQGGDCQQLRQALPRQRQDACKEAPGGPWPYRTTRQDERGGRRSGPGREGRRTRTPECIEPAFATTGSSITTPFSSAYG